MLHKLDKSSALFATLAVVFFFIGGLLTTLAPPLLDRSWSRPAPALQNYAAMAAKGDAVAQQV